MEKKDIKKILILIGILLFVILWRVLFGDRYSYSELVTSRERGYELINQAIMKGKGDIYFDCAVTLDFADFDRILGDAVKDGSYIGCEIYSIKYMYAPKNGHYEVNVEVENPNRLSSWLMEIRAGRIASQFEDLPTDYEKVKATHDYLVLLNRYVYFEGGAFSALYKERSSCTGYAYAFYAIMNKLNIPATIEVGGYHAWNRVMVDGKWYNIDVTWDDPDWKEISYDYFLKCDKDWYGHHHGGSDAEESLGVHGLTASQYYDMVPKYNLIRQILIILLCVVPVAILAYVVMKRGKKEKEVVQNALMSVGDWHFMPPMRIDDRFNVIVKKSSQTEKTETWYAENGKYFIKKTEGKEISGVEEITEEKFSGEVNFLIMSARARNAARYKELLTNALDQLGLSMRTGY